MTKTHAVIAILGAALASCLGTWGFIYGLVSLSDGHPIRGSIFLLGGGFGPVVGCASAIIAELAQRHRAVAIGIGAGFLCGVPMAFVLHALVVNLFFGGFSII